MRLLLFCLLTFVASVASSAARPNVILILADDMAVGDLASQNGELSSTPHLDAFAAESAVFETAYSSSPVCAPARATLLTGRYPHRTGPVSLNQLEEPVLTRLKLDEVTIADRFRANGYATGIVGKWHLGLGDDHHPLRRGFENFVGFLNNTYVDTYFDFRFEHEGEMRSYEKDNYLTDVISLEAIEFVKQRQDEPFFLHIAHYAPHRPLSAPNDLVDKYLAKGLHSDTAHVYAMVEIMDRGVGELLEEVDNLGIAENTIVIFASDNGPDSLIEPRVNAPYRGTKYMVNEGGIRVPFFVRWKGQVDPSKITETIHFADVVPTLIEICELEKGPEGLPLDGVSFAPLLGVSDCEYSPPRQRFWQWNRSRPRITHNGAVREGDWKLIKPFVTKNYPKGPSDLPVRLYDLGEDPTESNDLAGENPDIAARLYRDYRAWFTEIEKDRKRPSAACE
ncbi:MAG: sulfatase-like hydrolase/transferase [Verrucomicrobiota bacterium]